MMAHTGGIFNYDKGNSSAVAMVSAVVTTTATNSGFSYTDGTSSYVQLLVGQQYMAVGYTSVLQGAVGGVNFFRPCAALLLPRASEPTSAK